MNRLPRIRGNFQLDARNIDPQPVDLDTLVREWAGSPARRRLLRGLIAWRRRLRAASIVEAVLWLGGSFLDIDVEAPGDLDVTTLLRPPGSAVEPDRAAWRAHHADLFDREVRLTELGLDGPILEMDAPEAFRGVQRCYAVYCSSKDGSVHGFLELSLGAEAEDEAATTRLDALPAAPRPRVFADASAAPGDAIVRAIVAAYAAADGVWALALGGSRARDGGAGADDRSDWDFVVVVDAVKSFASQRRLALTLSGHLIEVTLKSPPGTHLRRIVLTDGRSLDLTFVARAALADPLRSSALSTVVTRELRVLIDREGILVAACARAALAPAATPTFAVFAAAVQRFFAFALPVAHAIQREDLWAASALFENALKTQALMAMARWHALASGVDLARIGPVTSGRRLERWAPPWLLAQLPAMHPAFEGEAMVTSLRATMDTFARLTLETANRLAFADPGPVLVRGRAVVERALEPRARREA